MPRRKSAVFGFSMALGAFLSRARLERALRGLLNLISLSTGIESLVVAHICLNISKLFPMSRFVGLQAGTRVWVSSKKVSEMFDNR